MRWKMRKECGRNAFSVTILWIYIICCLLNGANVAQGNYAEADDLLNELDRPSEYYEILSRITIHQKVLCVSTGCHKGWRF